MFIVIYSAAYGHEETFGPFQTKKEAVEWMKVDVQHAIAIAANEADIKYNAITDGDTIRIEEYGEWTVHKVQSTK